MGKFINEFKEFAVKGNAVDMAVGVIIGGAFGKIVTSIVNDIIMPPIGWIIGGVNFSDLKFELPTVKIGSEELAAATINYGAFIQNHHRLHHHCLLRLHARQGHQQARQEEEEGRREGSRRSARTFQGRGSPHRDS